MTDKLTQLAEDFGFSDPTLMIQEYLFDGVMPAICMNEGCDYSTDLEPDQTAGWCECCGTPSMKSAAVLAGVI